MKKKLFSIGLTVGVLALGAAYLAKKTGFFTYTMNMSLSSF